MSEQTKFLLDESRIPQAWYNIAADLPVAQPPPLNPATGKIEPKTTYLEAYEGWVVCCGIYK